MSETAYDVIVIGGGPGGYVAAIRAAQLGLATAVVEREHLGGICLNWGCIPTKTLLHTSDLLREMRHASAHGLKIAEPAIDLPAMVERSRGAAAQLNQGVGFILKKHGVQVFDGVARLDGRGRVSVAGNTPATLISDAIILSPGARARALPGIDLDDPLVWTYRDAMVPERLPERLLVVGAGAIGIEFASFYATLGSDVTVVEVLPEILPTEDPEIAAHMRAALRAQGIRVLTEAKLTSFTNEGSEAHATIATESGAIEERFSQMVLAVGVTGNVESLGLETTQVEVEQGFVRIDECYETAEPGIYALGDATGAPCLAHKAMHQGVAAAELIAGRDIEALDHRRIPACTYAYPQVASVGLTEPQARARGYEPKVGRFPFVGNGKAVAVGETDGLAKTLFAAKTGELLGAHLIGAGVTELIQGFAVAMSCETTEAELIDTIFPHPTVSESMHESVLAAHDRALHA